MVILAKPVKVQRVSKPLRRVPVQRGKVDKPRKRLPKGRKTKRGPVAKRRAAKREVVTQADLVWRNWVRERADGRCERTGFKGTDAHHVWPKKSHPKLRHEPSNGIYLWHEEHESAHRDMKTFRRWFAARFPLRWEMLEAARLA